MGSSWRAFGGVFWDLYDAAIFSDQGGGASRTARPSYEVWTYGTQIASRPSLAEAKAVVEYVYGPLAWSRVVMPKIEVVHRYFGPTTEFTAPTTVWAVDVLPRLG